MWAKLYVLIGRLLMNEKCDSNMGPILNHYGDFVTSWGHRKNLMEWNYFIWLFHWLRNNFNLLVTCASRSQWLRGLRYELSSLARTLVSRVRFPLNAWLSACVYSVTGWSPVQGVLPTVLCSKVGTTGKRKKELKFPILTAQLSCGHGFQSLLGDQTKPFKSLHLTRVR
jgi:hypothetical protein